MNPFRADLHCHTTCSDGTLTPSELINLAKESNLQGLAITDHDTIGAYRTAIDAAKNANIDLITGVEFSSSHKDVTVHVLGYAFSPTSEIIHKVCERHQKRREDRNSAIVEKLKEHHMPLTIEEVHACAATTPFNHGSIGRPHIAMAMLKKGYIQIFADAFHLYIGEGKPCYVRGDPFPVEEAIESIHDADGFAIIAHPHLIKESNIVSDLLKMNFDGLEGYYARLGPAQNERWTKIATKKNWLITGGSDFHGAMKPQNALGSSWVAEDTFKILKDRYLQNK